MKAFIDAMSKLDFNEREFELSVTQRINEILQKEDLEYLSTYIEDKSNDDVNKRFAAFFTLFTHYRRNRKLNEIDSLFNNYLEEFRHIEILKQVLIMNKTLRVKNLSNLEEIKNEVYDTIKSNPVFKNHLGMIHLYCHSLLDFLESKESVDLDRDKSIKLELEEASEFMNYVIENSETYAKSYFTRGRILLFLQKYDEAIQDFIKAQLSEDCNRSDYSIIIAGYKDYVLYAKQLHQNEEIKKQGDEVARKLKELNANNFKLISMFTGIITIVIGNVSAAVTSTKPVQVMFVLNGIFAIFFGIILLITNAIFKEEKNKTPLSVWLTSGFLMLLGLVILVVIFTLEILL